MLKKKKVLKLQKGDFMKNRYFPYIGILLAALIVVPLARGVHSQEATLQSADQLWNEKSFRLAAGKYKAILDSGDLGSEAKGRSSSGLPIPSGARTSRPVTKRPRSFSKN